MVSKRLERIIIHGGYPKTATTTIQQCLYANRSLLLENLGILYPSISICHTNFLKILFTQRNNLFYQAGEIEEKYDLSNRQECEKRVNEFLVEEIESSSCSSLLISSEFLVNMNLLELQALKVWLKQFTDNIEVLIYTRNPISFATSFAQQLIKGGAVLSEIYENPPQTKFKQRITRLSNVFGREKIKLLPFEASVKKFDHILDSLLTGVNFNIRFNDLPYKIHKSNSSMSMQSAVIWSRINELNKENNYKLKISHKVYKTLIGIPGSKFNLPVDVQSAISESTYSDLQWLSTSFSIHYQLPNSEILNQVKIENADTLNAIGTILYDFLR